MKELSLNILDIAQNSVKARATFVEIIIEEKGDNLSFEIIDDGCGMSAEFLKNVTNPFTTTRKTRSVFASFVKSSIDFIPLGDIIGTICILIQGADNIDFLFVHKIEENEIRLDTREMREMLGDDIPLSSPEVLAWAKEYLTDCYNSL